MSVPFVGCAADGQMGPVAAPTGSRSTPVPPAWALPQLAYYASTGLGVFAPRGWHCIGMYGSGGVTLVVTPEPHDANDLRPETRLTGPAIELSRMNGTTSGRFEVAQIGARIFPVSRAFVQQVIDLGLVPETEFPTGPYPADTLIRRSDTEIEFVTAANHEGLGTSTRIAMNGQTISGVAILLPEVDMDLVILAVRLPSDTQALTPAIIRAVERDRGKPPLDVSR
jgi:hypothetical protein